MIPSFQEAQLHTPFSEMSIYIIFPFDTSIIFDFLPKTLSPESYVLWKIVFEGFYFTFVLYFSC